MATPSCLFCHCPWNLYFLQTVHPATSSDSPIIHKELDGLCCIKTRVMELDKKACTILTVGASGFTRSFLLGEGDCTCLSASGFGSCGENCSYDSSYRAYTSFIVTLSCVVRYCVKIETSGCSKRGQDTCMNHHEPPNILAQADGDGGRVVDASSCDLLACGICDRSLGVGMWTPVLLKLWHMTSF